MSSVAPGRLIQQAVRSTQLAQKSGSTHTLVVLLQASRLFVSKEQVTELNTISTIQAPTRVIAALHCPAMQNGANKQLKSLGNLIIHRNTGRPLPKAALYRRYLCTMSCSSIHTTMVQSTQATRQFAQSLAFAHAPVAAALPLASTGVGPPPAQTTLATCVMRVILISVKYRAQIKRAETGTRTKQDTR